MLVHGYRIQGGKSLLAMDTLHGTSMSGHAMFVHVFCIGNSELGCTWFLKYKYILRNNPPNGKRGQRSAVRRWASGPSLTHTVFLSSASFSLHSLKGFALCSQITVFVYILKTKRNRGTQGNEGGRWAPSDRRVRGGRPGQGGRCHPQISPNFGPQFLRRKYGNFRNFYGEIVLKRCQANSLFLQFRWTDRLSQVAIAIPHKAWIKRWFHHFLDCLRDIIKLSIGTDIETCLGVRANNGVYNHLHGLCSRAVIYIDRLTILMADHSACHQIVALRTSIKNWKGTQGDTETKWEQCRKLGWKRPRTDHGAIMVESHFFGRERKKRCDFWWEWTKIDSQPGNRGRWSTARCWVSIRPLCPSVRPSVCSHCKGGVWPKSFLIVSSLSFCVFDQGKCMRGLSLSWTEVGWGQVFPKIN